MVDDSSELRGLRTTGYLKVKGQGEIACHDMRDLLAGMEDAYVVVARVEWVIAQRLASRRAALLRARRYRFSEFLVPWLDLDLSRALDTEPPLLEFGQPLVVSRVVLQSPGFWEFMGSLNPLEVIRKYLNDRHERRKDTEYRNRAEADRLSLDNAALALDVIQRYRELEEGFGEGRSGDEVLVQYVSAAVRPALQRLAEFSDRGLIEGGSAAISRELPAQKEPPAS